MHKTNALQRNNLAPRQEPACCGPINEAVCFSFLALQHVACHDWPDAHGVSHCFSRSVVLPCSCNNQHFALRLPPAPPAVTGVPRLPPPQVRPSSPSPSFLRPVTADRQSSFWSMISCISREAYAVHLMADQNQFSEQLNRALVSEDSC